MLNKLRHRAQEEKGFTLIELLVVILIIGILAAIAIPSFLGQRSKGQDATAKTTVKTAQTAIETYFTDNQSYANATLADLTSIEPTLSDLDGGTLALSGLAAGAYTVTFVNASKGTGNTFAISRSATSAVTRTCTKVKEGGCKAAGATGAGSW